MSRPDSSRFPVTVTRLPLTRCEICGRTLAYQPGQASAVLTKHYHRMHPEALTEAAESTAAVRPIAAGVCQVRCGYLRPPRM